MSIVLQKRNFHAQLSYFIEILKKCVLQKNKKRKKNNRLAFGRTTHTPETALELFYAVKAAQPGAG